MIERLDCAFKYEGISSDIACRIVPHTATPVCRSALTPLRSSPPESTAASVAAGPVLQAGRSQLARQTERLCARASRNAGEAT